MSEEEQQHRTKAELTEDIHKAAQFALSNYPDDTDSRARAFVAFLAGHVESQYPEIAAALVQVLDLKPSNLAARVSA